jgi:indole-3-glycerol phosphate synthase
MTSDVLRAVVASARRSALERERAVRRAEFHRLVSGAKPRGDGFVRALRERGLRVIAECKRRSPSKGILRVDYDPAAIASAYEAAGAAAISVLTEPTFFDGAIEHLVAVRAAVTVPVLRKDFIVSEFQIAEARAYGADAVLLIVGALDQPTLVALCRAARDHGLAALVEVHDAEEMARAVDVGVRVIGVNSRNLKTLDVDTTRFEALADAIPADVVAVAESGIRSHDDLRRLAARRYNAFLVGERLMTRSDPGAALRELLASDDEARTA